MKTPKLITIGADGGGFELIQPWIDNGELPNIKYMIDHGVSGDLLSCLPPVTCPNWRCYGTGKNPGKLGLFWWRNINVQERSTILPQTSSQGTMNFWNMLSHAGYRVAVINTPLTYPPQNLNGYVIAGGPDASDDHYCSPAELEKELASKFNYRVHSETSNNHLDMQGTAETVLALIESRFEVAEYLMERDDLDFVQVTSFYINVLQHYFWNAEPVKKGWKIIDKWVGRFLEKGTNVWIMSDHGSMPVDVTFFINRWFEEKGFLLLKKTLSDQMSRMGINRKRLNQLADGLRLRRLLKRSLPSTWTDFIPNQEGGLRGEGGLHKVAWEASVAIGLGQGPVYVLGDKHHDTDSTGIEAVVAELQKLTFPGSNKKIAKDVQLATDIYHGDQMEFSPDLVIDYNHGVHIAGMIGKKESFSKPFQWMADNKREGIFLACGADMGENMAISDLSILDLAPSTLHLFNVAISEEMDGKVPRDIFSENSSAAHREVTIVPENNLVPSSETGHAENADAVTQRLRDIGYLD